MTFKAGDAIVHPVRGAGFLERIEERQWRGSSETYYRIELLGQPGTKLMIPISAAEEIGLRRAISQAKLKRVWHVLAADPRKLPDDHKARYKLLEEKLHTGDVLEVAEAVRDMAWRQERKGKLTVNGKRIYDKGMMLLAGEVAAVQGVGVEDAEVQVRAKLRAGLAPAAVM